MRREKRHEIIKNILRLMKPEDIQKLFEFVILPRNTATSISIAEALVKLSNDAGYFDDNTKAAARVRDITYALFVAARRWMVDLPEELEAAFEQLQKSNDPYYSRSRSKRNMKQILDFISHVT